MCVCVCVCVYVCVWGGGCGCMCDMTVTKQCRLAAQKISRLHVHNPYPQHTHHTPTPHQPHPSHTHNTLTIYRSVPLIRPPILYTTSSLKWGEGLYSNMQLVSSISPPTKVYASATYTSKVHVYLRTQLQKHSTQNS